jgi:hypothetical protein
MLRSKMSAAKSHLNRLVAQQLLHCSDVHALHDEITGERVPQTMPCEVLKLGGFDALLKPLACTVDESRLLHLEPRLAQIGTPIYSVSADPEFQKRLLDFLAEAEERSERPQAVVVEAIRELAEADNSGLIPKNDLLTVKRVADRANEIIRKNGMREEMSPKRAGRIIRSFGVKPKKKQEVTHFGGFQKAQGAG